MIAETFSDYGEASLALKVIKSFSKFIKFKHLHCFSEIAYKKTKILLEKFSRPCNFQIKAIIYIRYNVIIVKFFILKFLYVYDLCNMQNTSLIGDLIII